MLRRFLTAALWFGLGGLLVSRARLRRERRALAAALESEQLRLSDLKARLREAA